MENNARSKKILIVDDCIEIREALQEIFDFEGLQAISASDGEEGINLVKKERPDLIICDITMPKKNGIELYQELLLDNKIRNTPFIFLTAQAVKKDIKAVKLLGSAEYITKPFNIDNLLEIIYRLLK
jgi:CheY-like chemotaxis protein